MSFNFCSHMGGSLPPFGRISVVTHLPLNWVLKAFFYFNLIPLDSNNPRPNSQMLDKLTSTCSPVFYLTSLLCRLQVQTLPNATQLIGKNNHFSKIAVTF